MVQLPAMNTTQFGWVLSKLPNKPRPMGKVYQPEVAARGIVFAAAHPRRELWIGYPTYEAIIGNKIAPWYADWVLSRSGIKGNRPAKKLHQTARKMYGNLCMKTGARMETLKIYPPIKASLFGQACTARQYV